MRTRARSDVARSELGQSIVEIALSVPVLLVLLIGALDGARALLATVVLTSAAMAGAQHGALSSANAADSAGIAGVVREEAASIGATSTNPTVATSTGTDAYGEKYVSVTATFTWTSLVAYPGLPSSVLITRSATLQVRR